jgi:hypothetical protein
MGRATVLRRTILDMKNLYKFLTLALLALCCWFGKTLHDANRQIDALTCEHGLTETHPITVTVQEDLGLTEVIPCEPAVDDLKVTSSSVLSVPAYGSATKLYRTAWEYIEAKDGIEGAQEFVDAIEDNITGGSYLDDLAAIVAAIRRHEDGSDQAVLTDRHVVWLKPGETWACDISYGSFGEWGCGYSSGAKESGYSGYRLQAGDCAKTVQNSWDRYIKAGGDSRNKRGFISYLGSTYCPVKAKNDNGDNKYWIDGVTWFYDEILRLSK